MSVLNPQNATITRVDGSPDVDSFVLKYLKDGSVVAQTTVPSNYITANQYVQNLAGLNAAVPASAQGANLVFEASAANVGGASIFTVCPDLVVVVNPPQAPESVEVA